jgi:hypothetical protein
MKETVAGHGVAAFSATERHAVQPKNPSLTSCHSPLCLERWLTAAVKPARAAPLWVVAELGIVGDASD